MGNLCGKESSDPFSKPGRTLASTPAPNTTSSIPAGATTKKVGGPARPLGTNSDSAPSSATTGTGGGQTDSQKEDARRKAAAAAEARANAASKPKGKLGTALQEQKKQTRSDTLEAVSAEERGHRQLKASEQQQRYD